jgi:hypothetical protein
MKIFLTFIALILGVSIACSASRSAGSPTVPNSNAAAPQVSVQDQNPPTQDRPKCTLTLATSPVLDGLKLGITTDEVLALFPGSKDDPEVRSFLTRTPNQLGTATLLIRPSKYETKDRSTRLRDIAFKFLDGRVSSFTAAYNGPEYSHVDKFVSKFIEGTNLPAVDQWEAYVGMDNQLKTLTCADFEVKVFAGGEGGNLNYIEIKDLQAAKELKARRDKAKAKPTPS